LNSGAINTYQGKITAKKVAEDLDLYDFYQPLSAQ